MDLKAKSLGTRAICVLCTMVYFGMVVEGRKERVDKLGRTVGAARCIVNATHCHCALTEATTNELCLRQLNDGSGRCYKVSCESRYKCDCASDKICQKVTSISYEADRYADVTADMFSCVKVAKLVPRHVTGRSINVDIAVYDMFSFFRNREQIGFGTEFEHKVISTEIVRGDVLGIVGWHENGGKFGMKVRFEDLKQEVRTVDENWRCCEKFNSDWLERDFKAEDHGWNAPSMTKNVSGVSYDADVPWMWYDSFQTIYCRYVVL